MEETKNVPTKHDVPKCSHCGHVGPWKVEPVLLGIHWVIGIILMILGIVPGIVFLAVVAIIRSNADNRAKICPHCKAKNLFTFIY